MPVVLGLTPSAENVGPEYSKEREGKRITIIKNKTNCTKNSIINRNRIGPCQKHKTLVTFIYLKSLQRHEDFQRAAVTPTKSNN